MKKMTQHTITFIIFTSIGRINSNNLIDKLIRGKGIYICGSASSSLDAPPPDKNGVLINVTDIGEESNCLFNLFNHTIHKTKVVSIIGVDRFTKEQQFHSIGPIHQWPDGGTPNLTLNAMLKSTICWHQMTRKFKPYTFVITSDPFNPYFDLLIGMNARSPKPEVHVAYLSPVPSFLNAEVLSVNINRTENALESDPYYIKYLPKMKATCEAGAAG